MNICLSCEGVTATAAEHCGHCGSYMLPLDSVHYPTRRGEADAGNPLIGSIVDGKYRLEGVLGRGGLGTVFQAEHKGSLMRVAVKLLHPRFSERSEYRRALLPEARRAATVTNERCARLLDVGETADGGTFLAMELVEGDTLDSLVQGGALPPSQAVDILLHIAEALVAIHAAGLVHCDLSPRNVMVAVRHGALVAKVLDFGIARSVSMTAGERLDDGEFAGFANPAFSAPEHLAGGEVDPRADLYSLGALAWFALTGKPPIDENDPAGAARAAVAGKLETWPGVAGVPRRLQRLISQCLSLAPDARPVSAAVVLRELHAIRGVRRPTLARTAVTVLPIAVVLAVFAFFGAQPPFLRPVEGSLLVLSDTLPEQPQYLTSNQVAELHLRFGGFAATDLRLEVSRAGNVLSRTPLRPVVDESGETLTLAVAQPEWRDVRQGLLDSSRDGAIDVSFVVPGRAPLGLARIRLDDEPPTLAATMAEQGLDVLTAVAKVQWSAIDAIAIGEVRVVVELDDLSEFAFPLSLGEGTFELGRELAKKITDVGAQPGVRVRVEASDLAGNVQRIDFAEFSHCDVRAPVVTEVTGPNGEPFLPNVGDVVRMRVQLSAAETGCVLVVRNLHGSEHYRESLNSGALDLVEIPINGAGLPFTSGRYDFVVEDSAGNRSSTPITCTVRDRSMRLQFLGKPPAFARVGLELIVGAAGSQATLRCSELFKVVRVTVISGAGGLEGGTVKSESSRPGVTRLTFPQLSAGSYQLEVELEERDNPAGRHVPSVVPLRVLPDVIEVGVPAQASRFLRGLLDDVLDKSPNGTGYHEGAGWAIATDLRPYVIGTLWVGSTIETLRPLSLQTGSSRGSFLPEFSLLRGRNVLAVSLRDVLGRPVSVLVGGAPAPTRRTQEDQRVDICAEFYWHDQPPEPIGEELLVEHGQMARLHLRLPLPYGVDDIAELRLAIGQSDSGATSITADGDNASIASFDLPFAVWSAAARIADQPREAYAKQIAIPVSVKVRTPVAPVRGYDLSLTLRTTRSTLRTVRLKDIFEVPAELENLRLVPVLGPDRSFAEPVPETAPPRALFRPPVSVAVRNIEDFLLQDREITCGEARAIVDAAMGAIDGFVWKQLVHADDPLRKGRLQPDALLPKHVRLASVHEPLTSVDFFQAFTLCRLLGVVVAGDPALFRLPMGCELELAAFGDTAAKACNGPAAAGHPVSMEAFVAAATRLERGEVTSSKDDRLAGDFVLSSTHVEIVGLDFGVREWVGDLPYVDENGLLLSEWIADHQAHLTRVAAIATGQLTPFQDLPQDLATQLRTLGVVRGLALGEFGGLLAISGERLEPSSYNVVPAWVPGVLRTEQLRRDGRDLLSMDLDPRLRRIGFRVASTAVLVALMRGQD